MTYPGPLKAIVACCVALFAFTIAAAAGLDAYRTYDLAPGDAAATLAHFSRISGVQLFYPVDAVRGVRTNAVEGRLSAREALQRLLEGTSLAVIEDAPSGALAIRRIDSGRPRQPVAAPQSSLPRVAPVLPASSPVPSLPELVRLNPFEVRANVPNSYEAVDSNAVTAFRIELAKLPATTSVFTQTFMDDIAATSIQDVLINYTGMVTADPNNTSAPLSMPGDRDGTGGGLGIRGLSAPAPKRDGMEGTRVLFRSPFGYTDNFSTERIEVIEGPQSILYGAVGGGGVVNLVSKRPEFDRRHTTLQTRIDQYGGKRTALDFNVGGDRIALRVAAAGDERRNTRYNLGTDFYGLYANLGIRLGANSTLRIFGERDSSWGNTSFTPTNADLSNFLPAGDPRRGQDTRYLALTHQLDDLRGSLWNGPVDYEHISSFAAWWSSERIDEKYTGAILETVLGHGFSAQLGAIYTETVDDRFTVNKSIVPAAGLPGSGANPYAGTAVRFTPGDNWQSDRTKAVRFTLLHETKLRFGRWHGSSQTAFGLEGNHQGPTFASSGIDRLYYQADANWVPITRPTTTTDYGRVALGSRYFPIQDGIPLRPLFQPGARRITINGQNYVLEPRIQQDASWVTDQNPFGLVPNNPTPANPNGYAGLWNRGGETHDRQAFLANFTDWAGGKLTTLAGVSVDRFTTLNAGAGNALSYLAPRNYAGYQFGLNYRIDAVRGLRAYTNYSTAQLSAGTTRDFYGNTLRVPDAASTWPEVGLKFESSKGRWAAQLAYNAETKVHNETRNMGVDFFNAVNPAGINGRFNSGDQWVNVDRTAKSAELVVTATPTPNWRLRLSATQLDGEITNHVAYKQLYNDQFYVTNGTVSYKDGTPVMVDPAAAGGPATTPLTLTMINDPAGPFYASPDPDSGRITRTALISALTTVDPVHGSAATGVTGLPISAIQYNFSNPHGGEVTVVDAGDKTTGINEYTVNLQNNYTFSTGGLRGFGVFFDWRTYFRNRAYYTSYFSSTAPGNSIAANRVLYRMPPTTIFGLGLSYRHKLGGGAKPATWTTRLNIDNLFNASRVWVVPSRTNGALLNARLSAQPRSFVWTNSIAW